MLPKNIAFQEIEEQADFIKKVLRKNSLFIKLLNLLKGFGLPEWYVGGGSIGQIVWNYFHNFAPNFGVNDFDVVYFDPNTSYEAEDIFIQKGKKIFKKFPTKVEIRNQARVHLWFPQKTGIPMKPFTCVEEAISTFPTTSSAIGVTLNPKNKLKIFAPRGFYDILTITMRANKVRVSKKAFEKKVKDWSKKWPKLKVIPWDYLY